MNEAKKQVKRRRKNAIDGVFTLHVDGRRDGIGKGKGRRGKSATIGYLHSQGGDRTVSSSPTFRIAKAIQAALSADGCPGKCRSLSEMSEEEIQKLEAQYGCPIKRPEAANG